MSKRTLFTYYSSSSSTPTPPETNARPPKNRRVEFCASDIISDPGLRKPIDKYSFEIRDQVKRAYALRGPTQQPVGFTSARRSQKVTNMHFYHVEIFLAAILTEMNHRFSEASSELLVCMASLNPMNSFSNFDVDKLVRLAEIYAEDFDVGHLAVLPSQLKAFHQRAKRNREFLGCTELSKVAEIMVKTTMNTSYPLVYRLVELTLILTVATASVERVFSAMALLKTDLRSKIGDE